MQKSIAEVIAEKQREISISQFFTKNRHLLGFDNPTRALLMVVKELVDNSIDATEEMNVLPEIIVKISQISEGKTNNGIPEREGKFLVSVEDNGTGIIKEQIPNVFGRLLYGSKFFKMAQSRGQQGLGVSMSVLYSQLTTGKPTKIISKISPTKPAFYYEIQIDTNKNTPIILKQEAIAWEKKHGTKVDIEIIGRYQKGKQSVDEYIKQVAIANPHVSIFYESPDNIKTEYLRATQKIPQQPKEIKPHPYGVELGMLIDMVSTTKTRTVLSFLTEEFCRLGTTTAKDICSSAKIDPQAKIKSIPNKDIESLYTAIQQAKVIAPPTDCLSPIGEEPLSLSLKKEYQAEFIAVCSRSPSVYRGFPFIIEAAVVYSNEFPKDEQAKIVRLANKVPLLYQQGACAITEALTETNWKPYGLQQSQNSIPIGPVIILVHIASVWVPFTSEAKEAVAHYQEIIKEIKLALQDVGRQLGIYIRKTVKAKEQQEKVNLFEKYIPELSSALSELTGQSKTTIKEYFEKILRRGIKDLLENGEAGKAN